MEYTRDIPASATFEAKSRTIQHVRDTLASWADADDNPATYSRDVEVELMVHPDDSSMLRVVGALRAEPNAPYLQPGFDPFEGVDPALLDQFPEARNG